MTTLSERVERLQARRRHTHCKLHPQWRINDEGQVSYCPACFKEKTKSGWFDCTDYHGDPREAALDAAALLFDVATDPDVKAAARVAYNLLIHPGSGTAEPFTYAQEEPR